jgi:hypothetical protein
MIRIAITQAAFDAMPLGTMGYGPETITKGERDYLAAGVTACQPQARRRTARPLGTGRGRRPIGGDGAIASAKFSGSGRQGASRFSHI